MSTVKLTMEWHPNTDVPERDKCNSDWDILVVDKSGTVIFMGAWYTPEGEFMSYHPYDTDDYRLLEDIVAWAYLPEGSTIKDLFEGLKGKQL